MPADVYFENVHTKKRYKVVSFDREAGTVTLIGQHEIPFTEAYSRERFEKLGYRPVTDTAPPPPPSAPPPPAMVVAG